MDNAKSLFRVFDLAFFAPGGVLLVAAWQAGLITSDTIRTDGTDGYQTVIAVLAGLLGAFVAGALCHAVARGINEFFRWRNGATAKASWYRADLKHEQQYELAHYFWYMRATFANLAVALPAAAILYGCGTGRWGWLWLAAAVAAAFVLLSLEFNRSLGKLTT